MPHSLIQRIDELTQAFQQEFGGLTGEELNWRPDNHTWSIGQNLRHLILINESYFPVIKAMHEGTYKASWLRKVGFLVDLFGKALLKAVQPNRQKKIKTFPIWEPSQEEVPRDVVGQFTQHQEKLKRVMENARPLVEQGAVVSSPANKNIVYKLETAFKILIAHEERHLEQAREVLKIIKKEKGKGPGQEE